MKSAFPSTEPRKRRRGGRPYSGCGICRTRKIKCDERQPTCYNCERSRHYLCDGYEDSIRPSTQRSGIPSPQSPSYASVVGPSLPIDQSIGDLIDLAWDLNNAPHSSSYEHAALISNSSPRSCQGSLMATVAENEGSLSNLLPFDLVGFPDLYESLPTRHASSTLLVTAVSSPQDAETVTSPVSQASTPGASMSIGYEPRLEYQLSKEADQHLTLTMRGLLDHWQTHVCRLMIPTIAPARNPWLQLFLPLALQQPATAAKKALLYAILAVAAYNKAQLLGGKRKYYEKRAQEYEEEASSTLDRILGSHARFSSDLDQTNKHATLAAAITMTTVEVFRGSFSGKGYEHVNRCRDVIQLSPPKCRLPDAVGQALLQIFRLLEIIAFTSGWPFPKPNRIQGDSEERTGLDSSPPSPVSTCADENDDGENITNQASAETPYALEISYGISLKTLRCLRTIVQLAAERPESSWSAHQEIIIKNLTSVVFDTLDDLSSLDSSPMNSSLMQEGMSGYISDEIKQNHVRAFHFSTAIFFRRALCDGGISVKPAISVGEDNGLEDQPSGQELVSKALEYLENVDALSKDTPIVDTLWPGFIAAVEAVEMPLRHRAMIWFARAKRHGLGNISKAKELVMEVWRQVDRRDWPGAEGKGNGLGVVDWREVMREKGMYIMLT